MIGEEDRKNEVAPKPSISVYHWTMGHAGRRMPADLALKRMDVAYRLSMGSVGVVKELLASEDLMRDLRLDLTLVANERYSNEGDTVYGPFCGLGTVPYRAILKGRKGGGSELNPGYFIDQVHYLQAAEREFSMPSLFDMLDDAA